MKNCVIVGLAAACAVSSSVAIGDVVPVSRSSTLMTSWTVNNNPFPATTGGNSDSYTGLGYYSNTIDSNPGTGTNATQTSYLLTNGAYARVGGWGFSSTGGNHPSFGEGRSVFIYTFTLTGPETLYFTGLLSRTAPFVGLGTVRLFNNTTNTQLYAPSLAGLGSFDTQLAFADTLAVGAGTYRLEVRGGNNGASGFSQVSSMAEVYMTLPTPGAAAVGAMAGMLAIRRRRA